MGPRSPGHRQADVQAVWAQRLVDVRAEWGGAAQSDRAGRLDRAGMLGGAGLAWLKVCSISVTVRSISKPLWKKESFINATLSKIPKSSPTPPTQPTPCLPSPPAWAGTCGGVGAGFRNLAEVLHYTHSTG
jgi:hypothetical protein